MYCVACWDVDDSHLVWVVFSQTVLAFFYFKMVALIVELCISTLSDVHSLKITWEYAIGDYSLSVLYPAHACWCFPVVVGFLYCTDCIEPGYRHCMSIWQIILYFLALLSEPISSKFMKVSIILSALFCFRVMHDRSRQVISRLILWRLLQIIDIWQVAFNSSIKMAKFVDTHKWHG